MKPDTAFHAAHDQIAARVVELAAQYPELGLSFGYIGNLDRFGDDREWRIFTNRVDRDLRSVSYRLGMTHMLPNAAGNMTEESLACFVAHALSCDTR